MMVTCYFPNYIFRQLFFGDWWLPAIMVAQMDGTHKRQLVSDDILAPAGLAIDYPTGRLYWADMKANKIETVKLDGTGRHLVKQFSHGEDGCLHFSLSVMYGNVLFSPWCD